MTRYLDEAQVDAAAIHQLGNDAGHHFARVRKPITGGKGVNGRAITFCGESGKDPRHHSAGAGKMILLGPGSQRGVPAFAASLSFSEAKAEGLEASRAVACGCGNMESKVDMYSGLDDIIDIYSPTDLPQGLRRGYLFLEAANAS